MPTATALDGGQVARPAPSLTHTLTASALTAVSAAVQEKTALLTQHLAALSALAASPPPVDEPAELFHRYETLRTQLRTLRRPSPSASCPPPTRGSSANSAPSSRSRASAPRRRASRCSAPSTTSPRPATSARAARTRRCARRCARRRALRRAAAGTGAAATAAGATSSSGTSGHRRAARRAVEPADQQEAVWLRDERDDHQEARLASGRIRQSTRRHGALRPVRSLPAGVRQRQTPRRTRATPPPRRRARRRRRAPPSPCRYCSQRRKRSPSPNEPPASARRRRRFAAAARLRRPAAAALAAEAALAATHLRRAHADLRRWQWRRLVPSGGDAARPRTRRAMGPRHTRGRSGERAEREREPQGFT